MTSTLFGTMSHGFLSSMRFHARRVTCSLSSALPSTAHAYWMRIYACNPMSPLQAANMQLNSTTEAAALIAGGTALPRQRKDEGGCQRATCLVPPRFLAVQCARVEEIRPASQKSFSVVDPGCPTFRSWFLRGTKLRVSSEPGGVCPMPPCGSVGAVRQLVRGSACQITPLSSQRG